MLKALRKTFGRRSTETQSVENVEEYHNNFDSEGSDDDADVCQNKLNDREFLGGNKPNSVLTREGLTVLVVRGSIAQQPVDAIVNSVGGAFDLSQGALSKSILQEAGPEIQKELSSKKSSSPEYGDVTKTKGHGLPCGHVFHGVLKGWDNGSGNAKEVLSGFIRNCLKQANDMKLKSIAFPAVGTGVLGFPSSLVVDTLFDEADLFSSTNPDTTLNEIRFIVYEKDQKTFDAFEEKMSELMMSDDDDDDETSDEDTFINDLDIDDDDDKQLNFSEHMNDLGKELQSTAVQFNKTGSAFPSSWKPTPPGKQYGVTELDSSNSEFKLVSKRVMESKGNAAIRSIVKIERIENQTMYQLYTVYKSDMEKRNGKDHENERTLWHGTAKDSISNICMGGFNRSYCGKNAVVYGKGVYFARDFSYSARSQYSIPDPGGLKYIFMCKVLTGTFSMGAQSMIEPAMKQGTYYRHDSTVDDTTTPAIFVVFKDAQAYPEYLVTFK